MQSRTRGDSEPERPRFDHGQMTEAVARIGSTLDSFQTASEVVDAAVPGFADGAVVYLAERMIAMDERASAPAGGGVVVRRLAARLAGHSATTVDRLLHTGEVLLLSGDTPHSRAMATGKPVLFDRLDGESAERLARQPGGPEEISHYSSYLAMPLAAHKVVVGCVLFARTPANPAFGPTDVPLADQLASRAALHIDNARLYERERRTALALKRALLADQQRVPDGLDLAHRCLPVDGSLVGGDWLDIVSLPGRRTALIVGDAMGHGPEAATVMVQLRAAAHVLADFGLPPGQLLHRLDRIVRDMAAAPFVTCVATVIDAKGGSCVTARAGHPPPVLALPDGTTQILEVTPGLPLGLGTESFDVARIALPPGAVLAHYTDGLVESRNQSLDEGLAALRHALGSVAPHPGGSLQEACEMVIRMLREHGEDDITLLLARIPR